MGVSPTGAGPGWRRDPGGRHELRWHTGTNWTTAVMDGGVQSTDDPRITAPPAPPIPTVPPVPVIDPVPVRAPRSRSMSRTTRTVIGVTVAVLMLGAFVVAVNEPAEGERSLRDGRDARTIEETSATTTPPTTTTLALPPSDGRRLTPLTTIGGAITPKSVVASGTGLVFAQNMMYSHSVTVYDQDGLLVETIPDAVDLSALGIAGHAGMVQGAPVEAAFSSDGAHAYVANYSMYGAGFGPEGSDDCSPASGYDNSFVYRIDTESLAIDAAI
jgi:DNA-binding beta-propeller fold protein YncE